MCINELVEAGDNEVMRRAGWREEEASEYEQMKSNGS